MKKILLVLLAVMLCACEKQTVKIENKIVEPDEIVTELAERYLAYDNGNTYYIGEGYKAVNYDNMTDVDKFIYPIYKDDSIEYLMLVDEEVKFIEVNENIRSKMQGNFAIVEVGNAIYLVSESGNAFLSGKQEDSDLKQLKKINKETDLLNKLSGNKKQLVFDNSDSFSKNSIVVKFKDGDVQQYISDYSKFCNGELFSSNETTKTYVFRFEEKEFGELKELLEKTKELDYIDEASLEMLYHIDDPKKTEESI